MVFGFINDFLDKFKAADFHISPTMHVRTVQRKFKENFGLTLRIYKGKQFADGGSTIAALDRRTRANVDTTAADIVIKASMTAGEVERLVKGNYGLTVQVANEYNTYCLKNKYTLGQAGRKEDLEDWCKEKGHDGIEGWLKSEKCATVDEWYKKNR